MVVSVNINSVILENGNIVKLQRKGGKYRQYSVTAIQNCLETISYVVTEAHTCFLKIGTRLQYNATASK